MTKNFSEKIKGITGEYSFQTIENTEEGIFILNRDLRILYSNPWVAHHLQLTQGKITGEYFTEFLTKRSQSYVAARLTQVLQTGQPDYLSQSFNRFIIKLPVSNSDHFKFMQQRVKIKPILLDGVITSLVVYIEDVTTQVDRVVSLNHYRKKLEKTISQRNHDLEELAKANATKDRFFSLIAHDLRSPIGNLSVIFNQLVQGPEDIDDELFQSIRSITTSTDQLLVNLLTWARNQKGDISFEPKNMQLNLVIESALAVFLHTAKLKQIKISVKIQDNLNVYADMSMLATVIRNLVNNAVKFTPKGGEILLQAYRQNNQVLIEIIDDGVGMDPITADQLFNLKQKVVSESGTDNEKGTGLGLVLCKEFVEKNGGKIGVKSKKQEGSRFWFTVPKGEEADLEKASWAKVAKSLDVLLVEDNLVHMKGSKKILEGYNLVAIATDGTSAVAQAKKFKPNLILMDIDLPGLSGFKAAKKILASSNKQPWIIALTCYSKAEIEGNPEAQKFDGYLGKPLDEGQLLAALYPLIVQPG